MTITALDTIKGAMRSLQVLEAGESPSAEETADGLYALNEMMRGFPADGINYAHTEITSAAQALPIPDERAQIIRHMLAVYWAPEFGKEPSPIVLASAENGRRYLQAVYMTPKTAPVDSALLTTRATDYNWETDN